MLKNLKVQNYALIRDLDIEFNKGFTTLTGETGAGKSILLGALSLIMGARADTSALNSNRDKCIIEGVFGVERYNLSKLFEDNDIDYEAETIIRREITSAGKSRAFINDTPVNLTVLKLFAGKLIDIHSQHQCLSLNDSNFQLRVIDAFADNEQLLKEYQSVYKLYREQQAELDKDKKLADIARADYDYNLFQYNKLKELNPESIDQQELEQEFYLLSNAEEIKQNLAFCFNLISEGEINILSQIKQVKQSLNNIGDSFSKAVELLERLETVDIEIADIAGEVESAGENIEIDPGRAAEIKTKLDRLYDAFGKYNMGSVEELVDLQNSFKEKVEQHNNAEFNIKALEEKVHKTVQDLDSIAKKLTKRRVNSAKQFEEQIKIFLSELGMEYAQFVVAVNTNDGFREKGKDDVQFLFSANKNQSLQSISKIASGGEISRVMLSVKAILSEKTSLPTIIFDEIDTGVSGEVAHKMASIMKRMAGNMQVISITHLPQIAAKGNNHYKVYKEEIGEDIHTKIVRLTETERVAEVARLLSGKAVSKEALENAKALIKTE